MSFLVKKCSDIMNLRMGILTLLYAYILQGCFKYSLSFWNMKTPLLTGILAELSQNYSTYITIFS